MSRRTQRIADQLREEIARVLRQRAADPRLQMVTLTRVEVAPDLSNATVFWSALGPVRSEDEEAEELGAVARGLERASGFLRHEIAAKLSLRRTPALYFRHDPSLELGARTLSLLRAIEDAEKA